ncbi:DNA repair exonuclease [Arachnia propionica]|uniref:DNA repair exonuclease n=1 Tax=Arachnia propionica TaxID=1750 RepID=A0A3P1TD69_9ACTN|nr:metallophosphoesterase [Arachnia propionica]RRD07334.1 DNA repair exonuclease [Arachnia propionica]
MRFIATADWQLGMAARFLDDAARTRYQQARLDAVARIGEVTRDEQAAFVVVGGDVFESNQLHRSVLLRAFEALRAIPVPVLLVPGNHDPLDASSIYTDPTFIKGCPDHVVVARSTACLEIVPGVEVVPVPWVTKRPTSDRVAETLTGLPVAPQGVHRVLVCHGAVSSLNPDRTSASVIDEGAVSAALADGRIHFAVVGDRHSTTQVMPRMWYPGTPEVTDRLETDPGNVLLVDPVKGDVEPCHVGTWSFRVLEQELTSGGDVETLLDRLRALPGKDRTAVWLVLRGTLSVADAARLHDGLDDLGALFARLGAWERHQALAVLPDDHDFADLDLSGFAAAAVAELVQQSGSDEVARDALGLLHRLTRSVR